MGRKKIDMSGGRRGTLTILNINSQQSTDTRKFYDCKCDCGSDVTLNRDSLYWIKTCGRCDETELLGSEDPHIKPESRLTEKLCTICRLALPDDRHYNHVHCSESVDFLDMSSMYSQSFKLRSSTW